MIKLTIKSNQETKNTSIRSIPIKINRKKITLSPTLSKKEPAKKQHSLRIQDLEERYQELTQICSRIYRQPAFASGFNSQSSNQLQCDETIEDMIGKRGKSVSCGKLISARSNLPCIKESPFEEEENIENQSLLTARTISHQKKTINLTTQTKSTTVRREENKEKRRIAISPFDSKKLKIDVTKLVGRKAKSSLAMYI